MGKTQLRLVRRGQFARMFGPFMRSFTAMFAFSGAALANEERIAMPLGALVCKAIEPTIEHARIVRQPTTAGLRAFVEEQTGSGACRVIKTEVTVIVVEVDQRSFALVEEDGQSGQWWTDAENLWGYFDTPAKVKAWKAN